MTSPLAGGFILSKTAVILIFLFGFSPPDGGEKPEFGWFSALHGRILRQLSHRRIPALLWFPPPTEAENAGYVAPSSTTLENWTSTTVPMAAASPAAMLWLVAQVVLL